jgi:hypothetical protein
LKDQPLDNDSVADLQRSAGNAATGTMLTSQDRSVQRRGPTTTVDFSNDEGSLSTHLRLGDTPATVIDRFFSDVNSAVLNASRNQQQSLRWMGNHLKFESSDQTKADVLGVISKEVFDKVTEQIIGRVKENPATKLWGELADLVYKSLKAVSAEYERSAKASEGVTARDWLNKVDEDLVTSINEVVTRLATTDRKRIRDKFGTLDGGWKRGDAFVDDDQARFISGLVSAGQAAIKAVPNRPPASYKAALLAAFVTNKKAGAGGSVDPGIFKRNEMGGKIILKYDTEKKSNGSYSYSLQDAVLVSKVKAGGATDALNELLRGGMNVYELGIPVNVRLRTENLVGGRSYFHFMMYSETLFTRSHWHKPAHRAWVKMPWATIDSVKKLSNFG